MWRRLLELLPVREGMLVIDDTSFPKQGKHSVGVARQYCGALGKIANCQVATTALLWAKGRAWMLGAALYLPKEWTRDRARCERVHVPTAVRFQEKVALGADAAAPGTSGRLDVHGRARRRGLRRRDGLSRSVAPPRVCPMPWAFRRI